MVKISHVSPSGDMARKEYYDRNPTTIQRVYEANVSQGFGWDQRWTYTVPTGKKFVGCVAVGYILGYIEGTTYWALLKVQQGNAVIFMLGHWYDHGYMTSDTKTVPVIGLAGQVFGGYTWNLDSAAHGMCVALVGVEFDA